MSGDAGNKSRRAKRERERASSFSRRLGSTTHRLERTGERVSVRLALRAVQDSVREDAHGRRSRQQVVVPKHHLRLRVHRVHARFGVFLDSVRRFPVKLAHGLDPTRAVAVCGVRARSTSNVACDEINASSSEGPFASVDRKTRVRLCRLVVRSRRFSAKQTKRRFGLRGSRRASANPTKEFRAPKGGHAGGSRVFVADRTAQRRSIRPAQRRASSRDRRDGFGRWAEQRGRPSKRRRRPPAGPRRHGCAKGEGCQGEGGTKSRARRRDRRARRRERRSGRTRRRTRPGRSRRSRRCRGGCRASLDDRL